MKSNSRVRLFALAACCCVALLAAAFALARVLDPPLNSPRQIRVPLEYLERSAPYCDTAVHLCVMASGSGEYIAMVTLEQRGTLPPCGILWRPEFDRTLVNQVGLGVFRSPCSGATFDRDGTRLFGPAERGLDRYESTIESDTLVVDLDRVIRGPTVPGTKYLATPTPSPRRP